MAKPPFLPSRIQLFLTQLPWSILTRIAGFLQFVQFTMVFSAQQACIHQVNHAPITGRVNPGRQAARMFGITNGHRQLLLLRPLELPSSGRNTQVAPREAALWELCLRTSAELRSLSWGPCWDLAGLFLGSAWSLPERGRGGKPCSSRCSHFLSSRMGAINVISSKNANLQIPSRQSHCGARAD